MNVSSQDPQVIEAPTPVILGNAQCELSAAREPDLSLAIETLWIPNAPF